MIVCVCRAVSDRVIRRAMESGANTVKQVGAACGAGTDCGGCKVQISQLLRGATPIAGAGATACAQGNCAACVPSLASTAA